MVTFIKRLLGTHKFDDPILAGSYPFLVTGCARSGTHFMAAFLKENGLKMGHEATDADGAVAWLAASEKYCRDRNAHFGKKLHLIRNPANALASLVTINKRAWDYIVKYSPECQDKDKVVASAKYWLAWNRLAQENAVATIRIEDFEETPEKMCNLLSGFFERNISSALIAAVYEKRDSRAGASGYGQGNEMEKLRKACPVTFEKVVNLARLHNYKV